MLEKVSSAPLTEGTDPLPRWFTEAQTEAQKEFEQEPYPNRKDELWRFSSVKNLVLDGYRPARSIQKPGVDGVLHRGFPRPAGRMVFVNDQLVSCELFDESLREQGLLFLTLEQAAQARPDLLQTHFMTQAARLGSKKFVALHKASVKAGTVLYVPPKLVVDAPFEVFHVVASENVTVFPHTLIIADEGSQVTFLDHFLSLDTSSERRMPDAERRTQNGKGFACGVNDLVLKPDSKLTYISVQDWSRQFVSIQVNSTLAEKNAAAVNLSLNFGGHYSRLESISRLVGSGARSDMLAISVAGTDQEFDQRTLQDHLQPDTTSDLLYKNSLTDNARTIFSGLIKVERGAHRTDAYQKVRNLVLSDEAEANSMPGLEILADDVRCTHGATSGQVEPEELFYMLSRGIPEKQAKALIVNGFLNEVIDRLPAVDMRTYLRDRLSERLSN
ncbi:MAG: Fe-S cluster assembly protein SufD [Verrucomicrobia bacterium]|nr:Fe-S cluster assembly protein SufD [Verrucomicrobiota bacterium]